MQRSCPNPDCNGKRIIKKSVWHKSKKIGSLYCRFCKKSWRINYGTFLYNIKTPLKTILRSLYKITHGESLRTVAREERISVDSIYFWKLRAIKFPKEFAALLGKNLGLSMEEIRIIFEALQRGAGNGKTAKKAFSKKTPRFDVEMAEQ